MPLNYGMGVQTREVGLLFYKVFLLKLPTVIRKTGDPCCIADWSEYSLSKTSIIIIIFSLPLF